MNQESTPDGFDQLVARIGVLLDQFEALADTTLRDAVFELLQNVDQLHREALRRLLPLVQEADPQLAHVGNDPVLRTVLELYGLLPEDSPGAAAASRAMAEVIPLIEVRPAPSREPGFVPLDQIRLPLERLRAPVFVPALALDALAEGSMRGLEVEGVRVLLCRIGDEVAAFRNVCPGSALPLDLGRLDGTAIVCPWHDCRFDARSGRRLDGGHGRLDVLPLSITGGTIRLALGTEQ